MAIYHMSVKIISRSTGRSSVGASAYRAGQKLKNKHDGVIHDYRKKKGVVYSEVLLPENAPKEFKNRETLWNEVEKIEKRSTAQLSREVEVALPMELDFKEQKNLVLDYVKENFVSKGMCADVAIHDKGDGNTHSHIMLTMRSIDERGTFMPKSRFIYELDNKGNKIYNPKNRQYKGYKENVNDWNNRDNVEVWRKNWSESVNQKMKEQGIGEKIDHRSFERQELEQIPTIHLGSSAHQLEKRGIRTERGNINREIRDTNNTILSIDAQLFMNGIDNYYIHILQEQEKKAEKKPLRELVEYFKKQETKIIQLDRQIEHIKEGKDKFGRAGRTAIEQKKKMLSTFEVIKVKCNEKNNLKEEIRMLEENHIPVFRNNKPQIEKLTQELENLEREYVKINQEFRKEHQIEKITDESVEERAEKYDVKVEESKEKYLNLGEYQGLEKEKNEITKEYKKELVIAEVRDDYDLLAEELFKSNPHKGFNLSLIEARMISNEDRLEIAEELSQSNLELSEKIIEGVEKSFTQQNEIEMDFDLEL